MKTYEVEIKSLLGSKENADKLKTAISGAYPSMKLVSKGKQLNHYFNVPADLVALEKALKPLVPAGRENEFANAISHSKKVSLRTRQTDTEVLLVMKISVGDGTSSNGVTRVEFEFPVSMSLQALDRILLDSCCTYQAKWSREREEYADEGMHVCIDKNAGYGYLAEFEKVTTDEASLAAVRQELLGAMKKLGFAELPQDRLERMFAHYNAHWPEYYGTDRTFVVE
ncbi:MAG: CYTH domain-containing protein [Patescibacteria group bacterium]|nr:CYTH domain-containing protein [Patescibacteria group bacterium]